MAKITIEFDGEYEMSKTVSQNKVYGGIGTKLLVDCGDSHTHFLKLPSGSKVKITEFDSNDNPINTIRNVYISVGEAWTAKEWIGKMNDLISKESNFR